RTVMLNHIAEQLRLSGGRKIELGGRERTVPAREAPAAPDAVGTGYLVEFRLELGLPVWRYQVDGIVIERRIFLPCMQNTVHVTYELVQGFEPVELALRPSVNFRPQELPVSEPLASPYEFRAVGENHEIVLRDSTLPPLRMKLFAEEPTFTLKSKRITNILYPVEESRGYEAQGDVWSPGYFRFTVRPGSRATLIASTESFEAMEV